MTTSGTVGTIGDAARKYGVDGATIWHWITSGRLLPNGVRLVALPEERIIDPRTAGDEPTLWIVREELPDQ